MKHITIRKILIVVGMVGAIGLVPNIASAKPSIRIELPGISIGTNDRYNQKRYYNNRQYDNRRYNNRYRNNSYRTYRYSPSRNTYRSNQYYYQPSRRVYTPSYQSAICPEPGYSENYYEGHGCYQHKDHYHCE